MLHLVGEAGIMALSCLLIVVLSVVYPVAAFEAGERDGLDTRTETATVTRELLVTTLNNSQLQVPDSRLREQDRHSHAGAILSNSQTLTPGSCSGKDIIITQEPRGVNKEGIPRYKVEILNNCNSTCPVSNLHLNCGWFASVTPLNRDLFKRIALGECLVMGGKPVPRGTLISFTYTYFVKFTLSFKSANFC